MDKDVIENNIKEIHILWTQWLSSQQIEGGKNDIIN